MLSLNKISANAALFMLASAMQVAANIDAHEPGDSTPTDLYDDYDCKASNGCGSSSGDEWYSRGWAIAMWIALGVVFLILMVACCLCVRNSPTAQSWTPGDMLDDKQPVAKEEEMSNPSSIEAAHIPYDPKPVDGAPVTHGVPVQTV